MRRHVFDPFLVEISTDSLKETGYEGSHSKRGNPV